MTLPGHPPPPSSLLAPSPSPPSTRVRVRWTSIQRKQRRRLERVQFIPPLAASPDEQPEIDKALARIFNPRTEAKVRALPHGDVLLTRWRSIMRPLLSLGGTSESNEVQLYNEGDAMFSDMWRDIERAEERIRMETYILEQHDPVGMKTLTLLLDACRRGVKVELLYDHYGSWSVSRNMHPVSTLIALGATVVPFNPLTSLFSNRHRLFRTHRKILLVDDKVGYCGGMNIAKEYAGLKTGGTAKFRDSHLRLRGPCVRDLNEIYEDSLYEALGSGSSSSYARWLNQSPKSRVVTIFRTLQRAVRRKHIPPEHDHAEERFFPVTERDLAALDTPVPEEGCFVQVLESNVWRNKRKIQTAVCHTIRQSAKRAYITTPYFCPTPQVMKAIAHAATQGVDVRVITAMPSMSDVPPVAWASQHVSRYFLKRGVRLYHMEKRSLHAKTLVVDGVYSVVGSSNLDHWSWTRLLEANVHIFDTDIAAKLESHFSQDLLSCREVTLEDLGRRSLFSRALHWFSYQVCRL